MERTARNERSGGSIMELISITIVTIIAVGFLILGAKAHNQINPVIDAFVDRLKKLINIFGGKE